jgi:hypothetical protein
VKLTCKEAAGQQLRSKRRWEIRSAGTGAKGERWYAWALAGDDLTPASLAHPQAPGHRRAGLLLLSRARRPAAFADPADPRRRAALAAEEDFEFGKDCFGLDQSQVRLYTAIARHTVLVMAALAICAITAALTPRRRRQSGRIRPRPLTPGMIPLTVPEIGRLLARPPPPGAAGHWLNWRRRHQARSRWYHKRARLARDAEIALVS